MFRSKKVFPAFFLFSLIFSLFAENPAVGSLSLNFERTETLSDNSVAKVSGSLFYQQYPYVFVFQLKNPEPQLVYENSDGAFYVQQETTGQFTEGRQYLSQTCGDFLNWFKSDFGIGESGYKIKTIEQQNNQICAVLYFSKPETTVIPCVKMFKDGEGNYTQLIMYDAEEKILAQTQVSDYFRYNGFKYPQTIVTRSYSEGEQVSVVELKMSKVVINSLQQTKYAAENYVPFDAVNNSVLAESETVTPPSQPQYNVSTSAVFAGCAYDFYKKYITNQDIPGCNFSPTCSAFMVQSVKAHGIWGIIQGLDHLRRCSKSEVKRNIYVRNKDGRIIEEVK